MKTIQYLKKARPRLPVLNCRLLGLAAPAIDGGMAFRHAPQNASDAAPSLVGAAAWC
jgi:hypothetical protein